MSAAETISFGRHKGERWTRLPVSYLKWLVNEGARDADRAQAELDRRGTTTPDLDLSGHAIDRASLRCRKIWHETRGENEGLHSWLCRMAAEARKDGTREGDDRWRYRGMILVFEESGVWPVLKTVMRAK